jgi:hypothetical protein
MDPKKAAKNPIMRLNTSVKSPEEDTIEFVSVNPSISSQDSTSERLLIRANAGRYIWRQRRKGRKAGPEHSEAHPLGDSFHSESGSVPAEVAEKAFREWLEDTDRLRSASTFSPRETSFYRLKSPFPHCGSEVSDETMRRLSNYGKWTIGLSWDQ